MTNDDQTYKIAIGDDWVGLYGPDGRMLAQDNNLSTERVLRALSLPFEIHEVRIERGESLEFAWADAVYRTMPCTLCRPAEPVPDAWVVKALCAEHTTLYETGIVPNAERYAVDPIVSLRICANLLTATKGR